MRFCLDADQVALRDAVRDMLALECPPALVRAAWPPGDPAAVAALWRDLARMGLFGAAVSVHCGGLGLGETDLVPILTEVGYAAVPLPVAETMAVAAPLLAATGDPGGYLPGVLAGTTRVAIAGAGDLVPYGMLADLVLVLRDGRARIVEPLTTAVVSTVDGSRAAARLALPSAGTVTDDPELVDQCLDRADLATAAQLLGLGRRMLDLTVGYVGTRRQFGAPIGSFQAVQHRLADALLGLEFAMPAVLAAGWALAHRTGSRRQDVSIAVLLAGDAARTMAKTAIQCHGAIGYTVEYDLHLYAKRTWALAASCGTDSHLDRLAAALDLPKGGFP